MDCFHLASVTCDECRHLREPSSSFVPVVFPVTYQPHDPLTCPCCVAADEARESDRTEQAVFGAAFAAALRFWRDHREPLEAAKRAKADAREAMDAYWYAIQERDEHDDDDGGPYPIQDGPETVWVIDPPSARRQTRYGTRQAALAAMARRPKTEEIDQ